LSLKVGIYSEDAGGGIGGAESLTAVLAEAMLSDGHDVDVLHRFPTISIRGLVDNYGTTLDGVRLRYESRGSWALDGLDLHLAAGTRTALVGPTGESWV